MWKRGDDIGRGLVEAFAVRHGLGSSVRSMPGSAVEAMILADLTIVGIDIFSVKVAEVLGLLQADGWYFVRTRGSHRQSKHLRKSGRVTVPGNPGDDLAIGTLKSVLKQAGLL